MRYIQKPVRRKPMRWPCNLLLVLLVLLCAGRQEIWDEKNRRVKSKIDVDVSGLMPYLENMERRIIRMNGKVMQLRQDVIEMRKQRARDANKMRRY